MENSWNGAGATPGFLKNFAQAENAQAAGELPEPEQSCAVKGFARLVFDNRA